MKTNSPVSRLRRLDDDESGPNTVEWVLLVIVSLLVLCAIYYFVDRSKKEFDDATVQENGAMQSTNESLTSRKPGTSGDPNSSIGGSQ